MANVDEAYATFAAFGLIADDGRKTAAAALSVNQHAGALNRLLQFGECSRTTKTGGSFGEGCVPQVSSAVMSNMHPEVALPMERAEIGNHVGCTKERIIFYTAEPVQPHSPLPPEYTVAASHIPWTWAELDADMAALCGLRSFLADPEAAAQAAVEGKLTSAPRDGDLSCDAADIAKGVRFLPNTMGYAMQLPDGVTTRWRYRIEADAVAMAEFRVGNRDVPLPPAHALKPAAERVLRFFPPHTKLIFDDAAKKLFSTLRTQSSVQATLATAAWLLSIARVQKLLRPCVIPVSLRFGLIQFLPCNKNKHKFALPTGLQTYFSAFAGARAI